MGNPTGDGGAGYNVVIPKPTDLVRLIPTAPGVAPTAADYFANVSSLAVGGGGITQISGGANISVVQSGSSATVALSAVVTGTTFEGDTFAAVNTNVGIILGGVLSGAEVANCELGGSTDNIGIVSGGFIYGGFDTSVQAAGSNQSTAYQIYKQTTIFTSVGSGASCAVLPNNIPVGEGEVINGGTATLLLYPPSSGTINGGSGGAPAEIYPGGGGRWIFNASGQVFIR